MRGYLLDTNIVAYWFDTRRPQHERVAQYIQELPEATPLMISAITLGEIEFGLQVSKVSTPEQEAFRAFINTNLPMVRLRLSRESHPKIPLFSGQRRRMLASQGHDPYIIRVRYHCFDRSFTYGCGGIVVPLGRSCLRLQTPPVFIGYGVRYHRVLCRARLPGA